MGALLILVLFSATIVPMLGGVYLERLTIREEVRALTLVEQSVQEFVIDGVPRTKSVNQYVVHSEIIKDGMVKTCVFWHGSNGREYERCLLGTK